MTFQTNGLHHIAIRVTDLARARRFYVDTLGCGVLLEKEGVVIVDLSGAHIALLGNAPATDRFDPHRVGLDHFALAMPDAAALDAVRAHMTETGVAHDTPEPNPLIGGTSLSFRDPDGIAWELYAAAPA